MSRHKAREVSFKYVYQIAFGQPIKVKEDSFWGNIKDDEGNFEDQDKDFISSIIEGVKSNLEEIDKVIFSKLNSWSLDRIFKIDLAILRVAIYELIYNKETPYKVVVNEAVEIAKKYGNDDSYTFINGVLREVIKEKVE